MGGQHERVRRLGELMDIFHKHPEGLTIAQAQKLCALWGITDKKVFEYVMALHHAEKLVDEKVYDSFTTYEYDASHKVFKPVLNEPDPNHESGRKSFHLIYKVTPHDSDVPAGGGVATG